MNRFLQSMSAKFAQSRTSRPSRRERAPRRTRPGVEALEDRLMPSVTIMFDPKHDTSGMFKDDPNDAISTADVQRNLDILRAAADELTSQLNDTLAAIPARSGNNTWTATFTDPSGRPDPTDPSKVLLLSEPNLEVPANTLIIFVGGRTFAEANTRGRGGAGGFSLSSGNDAAGHAWENRVTGRYSPEGDGSGQAGARAWVVDPTDPTGAKDQRVPGAARTDVGPWGGSIGFDKNFSSWYFGLGQPVPDHQLDFFSVATHEIGHVLGITSSNPSWSRFLDGDTFTGPEAKKAYGGSEEKAEAVPVAPDKSHWRDKVTAPKDGGRATAMDPSTTTGVRTFFTTLDYAGLDDIGWELRPPIPIPPPRSSIDVSLRITHLTQLDNPDESPIPGFTTDGDYYAKVTINNVRVTPENGTAAITDDDFDPSAVGGWSWTQNVPADLPSVPVHIEIWDEDDALRFRDNEMDVSPVAGHLGLDLSVNLTNGLWSGDKSSPEATSEGNGEGDGNTRITFAIDVTSKIAQALVVANGTLTVQGDQFVPELDDDLTLDRTASGGLKVTLNGNVVEYAPGAVTAIVVNTGGGSNSVRVLATLPGVPLTVNGGGADRLTFGPGLPPPVFTPDANGLPGFGTVSLGGELIHLAGLEFVDGVAPDVTGLRLGAVALDENGVATVNGTFTDPGSWATHSLAIDWGDGTSDPSARLVLGERSFTATHRYLDDNPSGSPADKYTIAATVTDNDGLTDSATAAVTVNNVAPRLANVAVTPAIDENGVVTLGGDIVDPGTQDTFTLLVDWGEGSPQSFTYPAGTVRFSETHQYLDDNPTGTPQDVYAIGLTLTDDDTGQDTAAVATLVRNVAPVFTAVGTSSTSGGPAREGEPVTISGAFADVGTLDTHTATVDWGDGAVTAAQVTEAGGAGNFVAQHAYQSGGIYPVLVTLQDDDTGAASRVKAVFVTGVGVHVVGGLTSLQVVGTVGPDQVMIQQLGHDRIRVHADFLAEGQRTLPLAGLDVIQVVVLAGGDHVSVAGSVDLPAVLDGGDGDDHLNGGNVGSVLIGGPGDDFLQGGNARDILIGGLGADRLGANGGDDILIGGLTLYDSGADDDKLANDLNLLKLREEWNSGRPYAERLANLRGGVGPVLGGTGLSLHKGTTVFDDLDADALTGSAGRDWFFFDPFLDSLNGDHGGEETN